MDAKTAMVVDDSRVARMTLTRLLQQQGYSVTEQDSGEAALAYLQSEQVLPDIVFMDVMMGGASGLSITAQIKADAHLQQLPVVICTGNDKEADQQQALDAGAIAVLTKPADEQQLITLLEQAVAEQPCCETQQQPDLEPVEAKLSQQQLKDEVMPLCQQLAVELTEQATRNKFISIQAELNNSTSDMLRAMRIDLENELQQTLEHQVEQAVTQIGVTQRVAGLLDDEGQRWLCEQKTNLSAELTQSLNTQIEPMLIAALDAQLEARLAPLVDKQVNAVLAGELGIMQAQWQQMLQRQKYQLWFAGSGFVIALLAIMLALNG
jgi:CheY-like chemotaxis protein